VTFLVGTRAFGPSGRELAESFRHALRRAAPPL